jgi:Fe-Mn family superoxide dismutase
MFTLIDLPYAPDGLEPVISARTLEFHHGKHLQGYVDNLNKLIAGTEYETMALEQIVILSAAKESKPIFNNAGQILNHNLYFTQFRPSALRQAQGPTEARHSEDSDSSCHFDRAQRAEKSALITRIESQWGTLEAFQKEFVAKGVGLFGSGWVWLQADAAGTLSIGQYPGADNPVAHGLRPLLTFDVWEHAYYLDYQNRRAAHLEALWGIVDWSVIEERYGR